jgi:hypothetical protein
MKTQKKERDPKVRVKTVKAQLTKAEMIASIQLREAAMFLELKKSEREYGSDNSLTNLLRNQWSAVNTCMQSLGIKSDLNLPDNQEATAIICERIEKQQEA